MTIIEYSYLDVIAGLIGSLLALIACQALSVYFFQIIFFHDLISRGSIWLIVISLTVFVLWFNTKGILNKSPLEVLRKEVQCFFVSIEIATWNPLADPS